MSDPRNEFRGKRVLVVESELLVPFTLYRAMELLGADVVGPVTLNEDVLMLLSGVDLDGAILDSRMEPDQRSAVRQTLSRRHIPFVEACSSMNCMSGMHGCFRLSEAQDDLVILGRALFGGLPSGSRVHRYSLTSPARYRRPSVRAQQGARSTKLRLAPSGDWR